MTKDRSPATQDAHGAPGSAPVPPVVDVLTLLGESKEAILLHNGEPYRLRITASNKLILTK